MKLKLLISTVAFCCVCNAYGQSIMKIPNAQPFTEKKAQIEKLHDQRIDSIDSSIRMTAFDVAMQKGYKDSSKRARNRFIKHTISDLEKERDNKTGYLSADYQHEIQSESLVDTVIDSLNKTSNIEILASGGISNLEDVKNASGNFGIGVKIRLSRFYRDGKFIDPHFLYVMFNAKTNTSNDSGVLQKAILFPEINKREFVLGYFFQLTINDFHIEPTAEFSLNKYVDTSKVNVFRTESILIGCGVSKSFVVKKVNVNFKLYPYYNLINIDPKYWNSYNAMLKASSPSTANYADNAHPTFHTLGLQTILQIDNVILFCNAKYVLNKQYTSQTGNIDFIRFVYTIGTMVAL